MTAELVMQIVMSLVAIGAVYGAVRADLISMTRRVEEERRLRELHEKDDDETHHDIRNVLQEHHGRISKIEGQHELADLLTNAIRKA